jgi:DNA-binding NarL/FixJ family response regulator
VPFRPARPRAKNGVLILRSILIVDDHPIIATACRLTFESVGIGTVIAAHDAVSGYEAFLQHKPDIVIIDLSLHGEGLAGLELIKRIRAIDPAARILVFSMHADRSSFISAIESGAAGYLLKDASPEELVKAVQRTGSGRHYIDPKLALKLAFPDTDLSPREQQVLGLLLEDTPFATVVKLFRDNSVTPLTRRAGMEPVRPEEDSES